MGRRQRHGQAANAAVQSTLTFKLLAVVGGCYYIVARNIKFVYRVIILTQGELNFSLQAMATKMDFKCLF